MATAATYTAPTSLSRHVERIGGMVSGTALFGADGGIDVLYDGEKVSDRRLTMDADRKVLVNAGYAVGVVGRHGKLHVSLNNVGDSFNARFVK